MCREMKDSGIEWIGEIPREKSIINLKHVLSYIKGKNPNEINDIGKGKPYIGASDLDKDRGYLEYKNYCDEDLPYAEKEDVLVLWDGARAGLIGTNHEGYISSTIVKILPNIKYIKKRFFYWYLRGAEKYLFEQVRGTTIPHMSREFIDNMGMIDFSLNEQEQIVKYLDKKVSEIDDIILKQKSLIEKYKAYKQSLITETVTKGLNKNVHMKYSGIEWIGEIPSHWKVERIKYLIDFNPSYSETLNDDVSVSFAPMECVGNGYMNFKEAKLKDVKGKYTYFADKDIIMAKVTPCFENGNIAIANDLINGVGFGSSELYVFRCKRIDNKFMFYYLRNNIFKEGCISTMTGTGGLKRVSSSFIENYYIGIPKIDEQKEIAEFLDKKCNAIDCAISKKEQLIEKLEEYKKSLIYECVTGKREVN